MNAKYTTYRMRAEAQIDVLRALPALAAHWDHGGMLGNIQIQRLSTMTTDVEVTFEHTFPLAMILKYLHSEPDGHVMFETVAELNEYTPERRDDRDFWKA